VERAVAPGRADQEAPAEARSIDMQLFIIRGLVAIAWAAAFAAVADSLTGGVTVAAGILVVLHPLIDAAASLVDTDGGNSSSRDDVLQASGRPVPPQPRAWTPGLG